jgi:O-succinylbenzoic acid--CoA ligase
VARLVPDWLRQRAQLSPERHALIATDGTALSFAELDRRVDAAVPGLHRLGARAGETVGILAPNGLGFAVAVHALMRIGAVLVPLNTRLTSDDIAWQVEDADLRLVLDEAALADLLAQPATAPPIEREFDLDAPHGVIYTSGTTGRPKGAILTYDNHWWNAIGSALNLGLWADDCWLACLPLFHVGGLSILLRSVIYGISAMVHERFDARQVNQAIDQREVSIVSVVSTMLERMLSERGERPYPSSLRCVLLGGGPAPLPLLERALALRVPLVQTYGLSETASQVATLSPGDARRKVGSAGKPLMGTRVRIEDDEILVQGPTVSPGYLHQPRRAGWLHTGDLGYLDAEGYLYVLDRREDLIVSGGENVYPAEVEGVLRSHPGVEDAGVYGVPDAEWGQSVAAAVVLRAGFTATPQELHTFCRHKLASYKLPKDLDVVESLPRNAAGKLLRRELRKPARSAGS